MPASSAAAKVSWRPWTVALLLLACFVPRAVAAWQWDVLWGDTLHYLYASLALEQGDFKKGFAEFGLNIYPLLLIPMRHLGIDWQIAGKWFGVLMATCTVVPLWGWLRRMFDDRVALWACLAYAVQGKLITISPLIIRDATFWFLLATTLYCFWRAVGELRFSFFLAAGLALTLAVHTRAEGWLLLAPLLGWTACRWATDPGRRVRLVLGTLACLAVIPAALAVVNVTWLREHPQWGLLRRDHLQMLMVWAGTESELKAAPSEEDDLLLSLDWPDRAKPSRATAPPAEAIEAPAPLPPVPSIQLPPTPRPEKTASRWMLAYMLTERLAKGFTWVGSVLLLIGIAYNWRTFLRPEHLALLAMNAALLVISGLRYRTAGLDLRYFMPIVIVGLPWMALGGEFLVARILRLAQRRGELSLWAKRTLVAGLVAVLVLCSLLDGSLASSARMRKRALLGRWIHDRAVGTPELAGNLDHLSLDTFFARGRIAGVIWPRDCLIVPMPPVLVRHKADFVVLWNLENLKHEHMALLEQRISDYCGYRRVRPQGVPVGEDELLVFEKK